MDSYNRGRENSCKGDMCDILYNSVPEFLLLSLKLGFFMLLLLLFIVASGRRKP